MADYLFNETSLNDTWTSSEYDDELSETTAISDVDIYEYDVSESFNSYDWSELIPAVVVYVTVLLLGISGNALIIFTIARYRRLKTITNIFLASLASADLLLVLICVPVNVAKLFSYTWTFGVFLCKFVHYMQNVSAICSVLTLTAMSIERYYAIVHPMRAQYLCTLSQARKIITGTWIISFLLAMPTLWIQIQLPVGERVPAYWCVRDWENPLGWRIYELYMLILVLVLPSSIMAAAYAAIGREIWRVTALRGAMLNEQQQPMDNTATELPDVVGTEAGETLNRETSITSSRPNRILEFKQRPRNFSRIQADHRTAKQVVKMLVAVVVLFAICWAPFLIDNVLMSFEMLPGARKGPTKHMRIAFHLLTYANSCLNPLVYGFMSRNFRRGFKAALRLRVQGCYPYFCYCPSCCHQNNRSSRRRPTYKFSQVSRNSRTPTASLRFHEPRYLRSVGTTSASMIIAGTGGGTTF